MYASVRRYRCDPAQMDALLQIIDEEFVDLLIEQPGFCDYQAIDCGAGNLVTVSIFQDQEGADDSAQIAADFVRARLSDFQLERLDVSSGEVAVSRAAEEMLEPARRFRRASI
jgi:hypothetical protein